jgi:hypothetical protein
VIRLDVIGNGQSAERSAAESLQDLMQKFWVGIEQNPEADVRILVDVNCPGQSVEDIDIVVLAVFAKPSEIMIPARDNGPEIGRFLLGSFCAVIEVKTHRRDSVELRGDVVRVKYRDDWHDATRQSTNQVHSLGGYLEQRGIAVPYIYKFIWLRNVTRQELAQARSVHNPLPHNLLFSDSSMGNLLTSIWIDWQAKHSRNVDLYGDKLLISSDWNRAPADFNGISRALTSQEMTLLPVRPTRVARTGYNRDAGYLPSDAPGYQHSQRRNRNSFVRLARSLPGLLLLTLVVIGSSLIGIQRLLAWIRPAVQTSRPGSAEFAAFEGKYKCQRRSESYVLTISREGDRLYAGSFKGSIELLPVSKNEFRGNQDPGGFRGTFAFRRNAKGKVVSLTSSGDDGQQVACQRID